MKKRIALVGPGRVGQAVTRLLCAAGHEICAVVSRDHERARRAAAFIGAPQAATTDPARAASAQWVLLAVPDDHLAATAALLRRQVNLAPETLLIHFSGLHRAAILLGEEGPALGALAIHPLQSFATAEAGVANLPGTPCSIEGEPSLHPQGFALVDELGGQPFPILGEHKELYHAAACMASNFLVTLCHDACSLLTRCGVAEEQAMPLLLPLLQGTMKNLQALGPVHALTGPISRGDDLTVRKHLEALAELPGGLFHAYLAMGKQTLEVALKKGTLDEGGKKRILDQMKTAQSKAAPPFAN